MQEFWVVLEDEAPALLPAPGQEVELSCRWHPQPEFIPNVLWTQGDSLQTETFGRYTRVYSNFNDFEAVIAPPEQLSGDALSGVAALDRYLWIDSDYIPSFHATVIERAMITSKLGRPENPALLISKDSELPAGHLITHRLAKVGVH